MKPDIKSLVNSVDPDQLAFLVNSVVPDQLNFQLVLNEMGPGRTSRAWYFHSPDQRTINLRIFQ